MKGIGAALCWLLAIGVCFGQQSISGTVKDESGQPLPGALVRVINSSKGNLTDVDGRYTVRNLSDGEVILQVSFLGYEKAQKSVVIKGQNEQLDFELVPASKQMEAVIISATRADEKTPTAFTNVAKEELQDRNLGQDIPFLLRFTPSMVTTSDAGAGVGYTGMRIRGSDATRINVTVNGIPINDSESHGTYWVNMPDFASSVNNIQIQRGVGTSTNGAAAFGASINMQTSTPSQEAFGQIDNSFGSFNTRKHTLIFNTGLINDKFAFEGRLSQIASDGYIDRAESDLKSYYLSGGYYGDRTSIKLLTFAGKERTYQSWYGTPEAKLTGGEEELNDVINWGGEYATQEQLDNLMNSGRTFNYYLYENEVDNYQQDHYQLHISHAFTDRISASVAGHYTFGRGYYEQYRNDDDFSDYGLDNVAVGDSVITSSDFIRRRWLYNHFYGLTYAANYESEVFSTTLGGAYNFYDGDHYGEIIWAQFASNSDYEDKYYDNWGRKSDFNVYSKSTYNPFPELTAYLDLQIRAIDYSTKGIDSDQRVIDTGGDYLFFNPKVGLSYLLSQSTTVYGSFAIGNREPVRTDFIDAPEGKTPEHETLYDWEVGVRGNKDIFAFQANAYFMNYENQLVLTGALNDVGSSLRTNVDRSYRAGVELIAGVEITKQFEWQINATLSRNKIENFTEIVYDYGADFSEYNVVENQFENTDIAFSPNVILGSVLSYTPIKGFTAQILNKYVGDQYLDNTSNKERKIDAYFVTDFKLDYQFTALGLKNIGVSLLINNFLNEMYSSNGYTWGYSAGDYHYQQNNYYPQAGTNFLLGASLKF